MRAAMRSFGAVRRHLCQIIAGTRRRSLRHQLTQIAEAIAALTHRCLIHSPSPAPSDEIKALHQV